MCSVPFPPSSVIFKCYQLSYHHLGYKFFDSFLVAVPLILSRRSRAKYHWVMTLVDRGTGSRVSLRSWPTNSVPWTHLQFKSVFHTSKFSLFCRERFESWSSGNLRLTVGFSEVVEGWGRQGPREQKRQTDKGRWESMLSLTNGHSIPGPFWVVILEGGVIFPLSYFAFATLLKQTLSKYLCLWELASLGLFLGNPVSSHWSRHSHRTGLINVS